MAIDDLDTLIREADPARGVPIPSGEGLRLVAATPENVSAETFSARPRHRHRFHRRLLAGAGVAAAAAVVLAVMLVAVLPGPAGPRSAAAAVLDQAAVAAGQQAPLQPGQYRYTETQTELQKDLYRNGAETAEASIAETGQSWVDSAGRGHRQLTVGAPQYPTPGAAAAFGPNAGAGSPIGLALLAAEGGPTATGTVAPLVNVAGLPTDPTQLAALIAAHQLPVPEPAAGADGLEQTMGLGVLGGGRDYSVFEAAAALLTVPTTGMTPALASALFQVMATQPGVQLLGMVTDHAGQQGIGLAVTSPGTTRVSRVVVDPASGELLEASFVLPPDTLPMTDTCGGPVDATTTTCVTVQGITSSTPVWTDVVARGVVNSPTATTPPSGSLVPTATVVPAAPAGVVATVVPTTGPLSTGVQLSWTPPADTGNGPVTDYVVYQFSFNQGKLDGMGSYDTQSTATSYLWATGRTGDSYIVQAVNADGYSPASAPAVAGAPVTTSP